VKLLAIDTSTEACSAALALDGEVIARYHLAPREHAGLILPMVDELMNEAGLTVRGLDALAFGRGPGAFTGLRIAAGVIQGIAFAADLPVVPVSSLAALAHGMYREQGMSKILTAIDARIHEVYWAAYRSDDQAYMQLVGEELVCSPEHIPIPSGDDWYGAGSGWDAYLPALQSRLQGIVRGWEAQRYPAAHDVALLGEVGYARGEAVSAEHALPVYLRDEVAVKRR